MARRLADMPHGGCYDGLMWNRIRPIVDQFATLQTLYQLLSAPTAVAMLTGVSGYLGGIPVMWIIVASTIAFAMTAHGLLRISEVTHRMAVENKLQFLNPHIVMDCEWGKDGRPTRISKMNVGVTLMNRALFPIEYVITSIHAVVENRVANAIKLEGFIATSASQALFASWPDAIDLADLNTLDIKGRLDFEIQYGHPGRRIYVIKRKLEFDVTVHADQSEKPTPHAGIAVRDRAAQGGVPVQS